jgi:hypothetical protein
MGEIDKEEFRTIQMLLPFNKVEESFVALRPWGVISLEAAFRTARSGATCLLTIPSHPQEPCLEINNNTLSKTRSRKSEATEATH